MKNKHFKAINFDLSTYQLQNLYPGNNYRKAYEDIKRFFHTHGFSHRQGSGYISDHKLSHLDIYNLIDELVISFPWLNECINKIDVTDIGPQHDLKELFLSSNFQYQDEECHTH